MNLEFTGECFIPRKAPTRIGEDHIERYRFATQFVNGKIVLDIACGVGYGSRILVEAGALRVDGVDISEEVINYAKCNYQMDNISFLIGDISEYETDTLYDVIICFETIEHVEDYRGALANLYSLLNNCGLLLISSPNRLITSPHARSINDKPSNNFHAREFTIEELESTLKDHGFVVDGSDIYGQRQQRCFPNGYLRRIYKKLFNPDERFSPVVAPVTKLMPRYFMIIASKEERQDWAKQGMKGK